MNKVTILKQIHVISDSEDINIPQTDNPWRECLICDKKFKSEITSQNHDKKLDMTPGSGKDKSFKCDYCSETNLTRQALYNHILNKHKKCTMCAKVCPTQNSFENHMKVIHRTSSSKHTLEREPSLNNYKKKKIY